MESHHKIENEFNEKSRKILNSELRKIESSKLRKLSSIIDISQDYDKLLEELTRPGSRQIINGRPLDPLNLSMEATSLMKQQIHCQKSPTMALLNYWSITGRRRPTVATLLTYLRLCNMKWAERYVCQDILGLEVNVEVQAPQEITKSISYEMRTIDEMFKFNDLDQLVKNLSSDCDKYSFEHIYHSTNGFCHEPYNPKTETGTKIGEGRFSSVYRAKTRIISTSDDTTDRIVAAKLLKSECNKTYLINEINLIERVSHENILKLLGIAFGRCSDGVLAYMCLIYPYMENGSLLDCLADGLPTENLRFLSWSEKVDITLGIARGISHLHNFEQASIIHRDIKTANIMIDRSIKPKIGDFTLVRQLHNDTINRTQYSQNIIGTSVYMPPEAFRGDISIKFDSFSFGIVLLELLTGMRPFNEDSDEDLLTYINERLSDIEDDVDPSSSQQAKNNFFMEISDKKTRDVNFDECKDMFNLALRATESRKNNRPTMFEIQSQLERSLSNTT